MDPKTDQKPFQNSTFLRSIFGFLFWKVLELSRDLLGAFLGLLRLSWEASGSQKPTKNEGFLRFLEMSLFGSSKLLMALLGTSCGLLGPIRRQNGPQNGAQKWSKRGPKRAPKNDLKNDPKSADFGSHFGGSWGGPGGVYLVDPRGFWALLGLLGLSWPLLASLGALLGLSWGLFGSLGLSLGLSWALLGLSWGSLGALLASLGALLGLEAT